MTPRISMPEPAANTVYLKDYRPSAFVISTVELDVAVTVAGPRADALLQRELALEELASARDRSERIALDQVGGRVDREHVAAPGPDLLEQGLLDPGVGAVGGLGQVRLLGDEGPRVEARPADEVRRELERLIA